MTTGAYAFIFHAGVRQTAPHPAQASEAEESQVQDAEGADGDGQVGDKPVRLHEFVEK